VEMKLTLFLCFALIAVASGHALLPKGPTAKDLATKGFTYTFETYASVFGKVYKGSDLEAHKTAFNARVKKMIADYVANPNRSWEESVNRFTDETEDEKKIRFGLDSRALFAEEVASTATLSAHRKFGQSALVSADRLFGGESKLFVPTPNDVPDSVDWRQKGVVTDVKNQAMCGSCWAFASTEAIESSFAIGNGTLFVLSEQNILDCTVNHRQCGGTGGCQGGTAPLAFNSVQKVMGGIALESDYPYISGRGASQPCKTDVPKAVKLLGHLALPHNSPTLDIMSMVATLGPLAISVDASSWGGYSGGVFDGCNQDSPDLDHLVLLVGYGTDPKLGDYWLVRNSWGPEWGENGYIRLKREETPRCGIDKNPSDGDGCKGDPPTVKVCGTCGLHYRNVFPVTSK